MVNQRVLPRILFLKGMVSEKNTTDLMAHIININAEDDAIMEESIANLSPNIQDLAVREMRDGYPVVSELGDGTKLGIGYSDNFYNKSRPAITIHIKTGGGYVEDGLALVNLIRTSKTPINAVVHYAHSMGFVIASACDHRSGFPTTRMMFHDLSSGVMGTGEQIRRRAEESLLLRELAFSVITENTRLTRDELTEIYQHVEDRYFTGQELLDYGLLDEIQEYSIPKHKQISMANEATQRLIDEDKKELIGGLAEKLSDIRTRQMVIDEIYDLMDDDNMEEIERLLEVDNLDEISFDELEGYLEYIKDFSKEDPYDVF